jgi:hypothetical protein
MNLKKYVNKLCTPAYAYMLVSVLTLLILGFQNLGNSTSYCVGQYRCNVSNTGAVFLGKVIYVLFWIWALNMFCKFGHKNIAWFLFLLPYAFMILGIATLFSPRPLM